MNNSKKISIIVTAYNEERYIGECLDSILLQDYHNIEIIVVNDGSRDSTKEIIERYVKKHNNLIAIHKNNEGVTSARKRGLAIASGEYVCFVDGDDILEKYYISEFSKSLIDNPDIVAISNGFPINNLETYISAMLQNIFPWGLWKKIFSRKILNDVFTTLKDISIGEDLITNLLIAKNATFFKLIDNDGYRLRYHLDSVTKKRKWSIEYESLFIFQVEKALDKKIPYYISEFRELQLNSWKNLVINDVKVDSTHPLVKRIISQPRKGRISISEIILRFIPFHSSKRFLLRKLKIFHRYE